MIGVIGSVDSVTLVTQVAKEMGLAEGLVTRAYTSPEHAPACAQEIDRACSVIIFTGRVPHALTQSRVELTAMTDYIPHAGVDLYRSLVVILRHSGGVLPRVSIDTIDEAVVRENFDEVGLAAPQYVFDLEPVLAEGGAGTEAISDFHQGLYRDGRVDLAITCLSSVRSRLESAGVPVERVAHTHGSVRNSLQRATLTSQLQRSEASQAAVIMLTPLSETRASEPEEMLALLAHPLQAASMTNDQGMHAIATTRGALARALRHGEALGRALERLAAVETWVGAGLGHSPAHAAEHSRYALTVAAATRDHQVVLPDGTVHRLIDSGDSRLSVRDTGERLQAAARLGGIGPMTLSRLQAALSTIGRSDVTAKELARAYGVEPRSARRLLNALLKAGVAEQRGAQSAPKAGRPQVIYKIDVEALLDTAALGLSGPEAMAGKVLEQAHGQ